jgi:hypothetical protein
MTLCRAPDGEMAHAVKRVDNESEGIVRDDGPRCFEVMGT